MIGQCIQEGNNKIRFYTKMTPLVSDTRNTPKSGYPFFSAPGTPRSMRHGWRGASWRAGTTCPSPRSSAATKKRTFRRPSSRHGWTAFIFGTTQKMDRLPRFWRGPAQDNGRILRSRFLSGLLQSSRRLPLFPVRVRPTADWRLARNNYIDRGSGVVSGRYAPTCSSGEIRPALHNRPHRRHRGVQRFPQECDDTPLSGTQAAQSRLVFRLQWVC